MQNHRATFQSLWFITDNITKINQPSPTTSYNWKWYAHTTRRDNFKIKGYPNKLSAIIIINSSHCQCRPRTEILCNIYINKLILLSWFIYRHQSSSLKLFPHNCVKISKAIKNGNKAKNGQLRIKALSHYYTHNC